ncbi:MAG: tyrosine recombinase XerD [Clostridiales bacterium]|nr:tyrosine recombinase XerD [Clostridiales bacterium]
MHEYSEGFLTYLDKQRNMSQNSIIAYNRDVSEFSNYLAEKTGAGLKDASNTDIVAYLFKLRNSGKSAATINRKTASLRTFYGYLLELKRIGANPTANIKSPKVTRKAPDYLTIEEVDTLLSLPGDSVKGVRDKAMLELLYATGVRVSEVIEANLGDVNLRMGFITCTGEFGKARIIPMGKPAREAMDKYISESRPKLIKPGASENHALFVNYMGERITRQGLWKLLKEYARQAGMDGKITPQTLRNSFAVHMIQNGADLKSLQELLGHEDISATQIYLSATKNRIKDVYDKTHPRA